jgi:hypothetical protein
MPNHQPRNKPADHIGPTYTDFLPCGNGVGVRLVLEWDEEGAPYVRLEADRGDLEGFQPGSYYPVPHEGV